MTVTERHTHRTARHAQLNRGRGLTIPPAPVPYWRDAPGVATSTPTAHNTQEQTP